MQRFKLSAIAACLLWACLPAISSCASDTVSTSSSSLRAVPAEPKSQVVRRPSAAAAASIGQWADTTGMYDRALVSSGGSTCQVPQKSIVLKADVSSAPSIYLYEDSGTEVLGSWPGTGMERVPGCDGLWYYQYGLVTKNPFNVIFSSVGSGRYPADQEPGIPFSQSSPCFDYSNLKFRNAAFCGIKVKGASPEVSLYVDGSKVPSGGMVEIPSGSGVGARIRMPQAHSASMARRDRSATAMSSGSARGLTEAKKERSRRFRSPTAARPPPGSSERTAPRRSSSQAIPSSGATRLSISWLPTASRTATDRMTTASGGPTATPTITRQQPSTAETSRGLPKSSTTSSPWAPTPSG